MVAVPVPSDQTSDLAALQARVAEIDRRTIPAPPPTANLPAGLVCRAQRTSGNVAPVTGGARRLVLEGGAALRAGRVYLIAALCAVWIDGGSAGIVEVFLNYTTDGSLPGAGSPQLDHQVGNPPPGGIQTTMPLGGHFSPPADQTIRVMLSFAGSSSGSTYGMSATTDMPARIWIEDQGIDPGVTGIAY